MGIVVIASYKPKAGGETKLRELMKAHGPALREAGFVTDFPTRFFRTEDGTFHEMFEWESEDSARQAHGHAVIGPMWNDFAEVCEFVPLASIEQAQTPFCHFDPVEI